MAASEVATWIKDNYLGASHLLDEKALRVPDKWSWWTVQYVWRGLEHHLKLPTDLIPLKTACLMAAKDRLQDPVFQHYLKQQVVLYVLQYISREAEPHGPSFVDLQRRLQPFVVDDNEEDAFGIRQVVKQLVECVQQASDEMETAVVSTFLSTDITAHHQRQLSALDSEDPVHWSVDKIYKRFGLPDSEITTLVRNESKWWAQDFQQWIMLDKSMTRGTQLLRHLHDLKLKADAFDDKTLPVPAVVVDQPPIHTLKAIRIDWGRLKQIWVDQLKTQCNNVTFPTNDDQLLISSAAGVSPAYRAAFNQVCLASANQIREYLGMTVEKPQIGEGKEEKAVDDEQPIPANLWTDDIKQRMLFAVSALRGMFLLVKDGGLRKFQEQHVETWLRAFGFEIVRETSFFFSITTWIMGKMTSGPKPTDDLRSKTLWSAAIDALCTPPLSDEHKEQDMISKLTHFLLLAWTDLHREDHKKRG